MQRHYSIFLRTKLSREIQTESPSTVLLNTPAGRSICGSRRISKTVRERVVVIVGPLDFREPRVTFKSHFSCRKPILWLVECGGNNMQQMLPIPNYLQPSLLTARWTTVFPWSVVFDSTVRSSSFAVSYVDVVYKKCLRLRGGIQERHTYNGRPLGPSPQTCNKVEHLCWSLLLKMLSDITSCPTFDESNN